MFVVWKSLIWEMLQITPFEPTTVFFFEIEHHLFLHTAPEEAIGFAFEFLKLFLEILFLSLFLFFFLFLPSFFSSDCFSCVLQRVEKSKSLTFAWRFSTFENGASRGCKRSLVIIIICVGQIRNSRQPDFGPARASKAKHFVCQCRHSVSRLHKTRF